MYVDRLKIENLRCFKKTQVALNYPGKRYPGDDKPRWDNVNVFIGENGAGKSTVCQALCLTVLRSILATSGSGFRTTRFIRQGAPMAEMSATVFLGEQDGNHGKVEANASIKRFGDTLYEFLEMRGNPAKWTLELSRDDTASMFLVAYGANRRTARRDSYDERLRDLRYHRIASIFEPHVGMMPLSIAFQYAIERNDEVKSLINRLLPERIQITANIGSEREPEPAFDADGAILLQSELSDGYRIYVGWVADFITHLARVLPDDQVLESASGIVIIDEIDLLLHAEWQRHVVETIVTTFPNIQFLITTHSPIVAGTLDPRNLFLIDRVGPHTSEIHPCDESVTGRSVDEVLVKLFGLTSARAPELEMQLRTLAQKAMEGNTEASIEYLRHLRLGISKT